MKLLPVICTIYLGASCASWGAPQQNRLLEIPREADTMIYDLDTVQFISPDKFTIITTEIDNPDVMKFELKALQTLRQYCVRPGGKYPAPAELLQLGPPDEPVEQIEVEMTDDANGYKMVLWKYPYRRLLAKYGSWLYCWLGSRTENDMFMESYNLVANGTRSKEVYDCKRALSGLVFEDVDPSKAFISRVYRRTYVEDYYRAVCRAVMHQEPYLPE